MREQPQNLHGCEPYGLGEGLDVTLRGPSEHAALALTSWTKSHHDPTRTTPYVFMSQNIFLDPNYFYSHGTGLPMG